jgi:hypothetical protein
MYDGDYDRTPLNKRCYALNPTPKAAESGLGVF